MGDPRSVTLALQRRPQLSPGIEDLLEDLLWPILLRAASLSIRPGRVATGILALLVSVLLSRLARLWSGEPDPLTDLGTRARRLALEAGGEALRLDLDGMLRSLWELALAPARTLLADPVSTVVVLPLIVGVAVIPLGAICRVAACEVSHGSSLPVREGLAFAARRWLSLVGAFVVPVVLAGLIVGVLALFGAALLSLAYVDVVGGVLFGGAVVLGAVGVVVIGVSLLALPMLVPVVVCEGTDAIDAVQRAFAYVMLRPLRFAAYSAILLAQGLVVFVVVAFVADRAVWLAGRATTAIPIPHAKDVVARAQDARVGAEGESNPGLAARSLAFWGNAAGLAVGGWVVSYVCCAGTLLYLAMRRVCDGQDVEELWSPGMIEATMARTMRARAEVAPPQAAATAREVLAPDERDDD